MARKPIDLRQYVRRPDREFWLDLLRPPPRPTETDALRRALVARASLGLATIVTFIYAAVSAMVAWESARLLVATNLVCGFAFAFGMWMASIERHHLARLVLMFTLNVQVAALLWLTGDALGISVYAFVLGGLAAALFNEEERQWRIPFLVSPVVLLVLSQTLLTVSSVDFFDLSPGLLTFTRVANTLFALYMVFLLIAISDREVLRGESLLVTAREKSERLINAILPKKIADELRVSERMIADRHTEVTVLFADIAGFTPWASQQEPEVVVSLLEKIFSRFDACVAEAGAEKIKTIGDAYMVISGAPDARSDHAHVIVGLALRLLAEVERVREETGIPVNLRVGIHTGPVIAGVIGALRFSYDVWGDTVNTASRMESHGEPGRIQASRETRDRTKDKFVWETRGMVYIKGKGEMETWWLAPQPATN